MEVTAEGLSSNPGSDGISVWSSEGSQEELGST